MKHKYIVSIVAVVVAVVLLLCLIAGTVGCSVGKGRAIEDMMRKIPENANYVIFSDVLAIRGDNDLEELLEELQEGMNYALEGLTREFDIDIDIDSVSHIARGFWEGGDFLYVDGDFDFAEVRDKLSSPSYEYLGVEVWETLGDWGTHQVALMENLIIVGEEQGIRDCIDTIKGERDSLWDTQDARDVVSRLPDGFRMGYSQGEEVFEGTKAVGNSLGKENNTGTWTTVIKCDDEDAAHDVLGEIEEDIESDGFFSGGDVIQDGKFVTITMEEDI